MKFQQKIFRSATFEGMADENGFPKEDYLKFYQNLSENGVKNIITGFTYISQQGKAVHPWQAGIDDNSKIPLFKKVTEAVHTLDSKIYLQIAHTGRQTSDKITHRPVVAPSSRPSFYFGSKPKTLTITEIHDIIESFSESALRAKKAGFDGIQLHAAHGYLIHQFIHPFLNTRKDKYGTDPDLKIGIKFLEEIILSIRSKCGEDYPVLIKISAGDTFRMVELAKPSKWCWKRKAKSNFTVEHFQNLIKFLDRQNLSAIEISYGTMENAFNIFRGNSIPVEAILKYNYRYKTNNTTLKILYKLILFHFLKSKLKRFTPAYNLKYSRIAKKLTQTPIIVVGGFRSGHEIREAIENNYTDYVSLCRPFLREPDFIGKVQEDESYESKCVNCNICAVMCDSNNMTRCYKRG